MAGRPPQRQRPPREADSLLLEMKQRHEGNDEKKRLKNLLKNAVDPVERVQISSQLEALNEKGGAAPAPARVAGAGRPAAPSSADTCVLNKILALNDNDVLLSPHRHS